MCHVVVLPADQLPVPHEKHLNHRLSVILIERDNILVLTNAVRDLLLLGNLFDTVEQIPVDGRRLKVQILRRSLHFCLQLLQNHIVIAV